MAMNHLPLCIAIVLTTVSTAFGSLFKGGIFGGGFSNISFPAGGEFQSNLESVLEEIGLNTSFTGFNISAKGEPPNRVYGRLQCRADASTKVCNDCTQTIIATVRMSNYYNYTISCFVRQEMCNLRYENYSFIGLLDTSFMGAIMGVEKGNNESYGYANLIANLVNSELSAKASAAGTKGFAAGSVKYSDNTTIYVLVQCSRDLSSLNCTKCLSAVTQTIDDRVSGSLSQLASCFVEYDTQPLFDIAAGKSWKRAGAILGGGGEAFLALLILCLLFS